MHDFNSTKEYGDKCMFMPISKPGKYDLQSPKAPPSVVVESKIEKKKLAKKSYFKCWKVVLISSPKSLVDIHFLASIRSLKIYRIQNTEH